MVFQVQNLQKCRYPVFFKLQGSGKQMFQKSRSFKINTSFDTEI